MQISKTYNKAIIFGTVGLIIFLITSTVILPNIISNYLSSKSTKAKLEQVLSTYIQGDCKLKHLQISTGLNKSDIQISNMHLRHKKNVFDAKKILAQVDTPSLLQGKLKIENINFKHANFKIYLNQYKINLKNINLNCQINGNTKKLFFTGYTTANLQATPLALGLHPVNLSACKIEFNIKIALQNNLISIQDTTIFTPIGKIVLSGISNHNQHSFDYSITIQNDDMLKLNFPELLPNGYSFKNFNTNGTIQITKANHNKITLNNKASLDILQTPIAPIKNIQLESFLDNGLLSINLNHASIFHGIATGSLSGNINNTNPVWSANGNISNLDITQMIQSKFSSLAGVSGQLNVAINDLQTKGWQYNPIMHHLSFNAEPRLRNGHINAQWFKFIKIGLQFPISTQANNHNQHQIANIIQTIPNQYDFNINSGKLIFKNNQYQLKDIQINSPSSFDTYLNGYFKAPNYLNLNIGLTGFNKLDPTVKKNQIYPIKIKGDLPLPNVDFSGFF